MVSEWMMNPYGLWMNDEPLWALTYSTDNIPKDDLGNRSIVSVSTLQELVSTVFSFILVSWLSFSFSFGNLFISNGSKNAQVN